MDSTCCPNCGAAFGSNLGCHQCCVASELDADEKSAYLEILLEENPNEPK
jgi:hypothetical protein